MERALRKAPAGTVALLAGEELYQRNRLLETALQAYGARGFETVRLDCERAEAGDMGRAFTEGSLFAGSRLIVVTRPMKLSRSDKKRLLGHLGGLGDNAAVVITDRTGVRRGTLAKIAGMGPSYVCWDPWARDFSRWVDRLASEAGVELTQDGAAGLSAHAGGSLSRLASAVEALSLFYMDREGKLGADQVRSVLSGSADCDVFALGDRVMTDRRAEALDAVASLLEAGEEPIPMLSYLFGHWCRVVRTRELLASRGPSCNIERELGVPRFLGRKLRSHASGYSGAPLPVAAEAFASADEDLKTGGDPYTVLSGLVLVLTS
jgi:DNA polymerase III delta subunit